MRHAEIHGLLNFKENEDNRDRVQNGHVMEGAQPNAQNEMGTWLQVCARPLILDGTAWPRWPRWRWKRQHQIRLREPARMPQQFVA